MELFRTVFDLSPHPLTIAKMSTGEFINVNKAFEDKTGHTKAQASAIPRSNWVW